MSDPRRVAFEAAHAEHGIERRPHGYQGAVRYAVLVCVSCDKSLVIPDTQEEIPMPKRGKGGTAKTKKKAKAPVAVEWERLPLVEKIVDEVVAQHHPHLGRARIIVLGKPKAGTRGESIVAATARRAPKNLAALYKDAAGVDVHYLIEVGRDRWENLNAEQKRILIDHELCHFTGLDEKGRWGLRPDHDIEEFKEIIKRHGDKLPELHGVLRTVRQMSMFEAPTSGDESEA